MMVYYLVNTLVAMVIGLTLTNLIQPGSRAVAQRAGRRPSRRRRRRSPTC